MRPSLRAATRFSYAVAAYGQTRSILRRTLPSVKGLDRSCLFIRTLLERLAYAYSYGNEPERARTLPDVLDSYNGYRPHRALGGLIHEYELAAKH